MKLNIITACSRPQNLKQIYKSIKFAQIEKWYIVYDTSDGKDFEYQFPTHDKIAELACDDNKSYAGSAQINFALEFIQDGFVYIMDDDNAFHSNFWKILPTLNPEMAYTWDQYRVQEKRYLKGGIFELGKIDTSMFIVPRILIGDIKLVANKCCWDYHMIHKIHSLHKDKFEYIPKVACYHNYIKTVSVAICFFGLTRSLKYTLHSIQKMIVDPLRNAGIKYETYVHTYKIDKPYSYKWGGEHNIKVDPNEYKLLNPDFFKIEDRDTVYKQIQPEKYRNHGNPWGNQKQSGGQNDFSVLDNHLLSLWSQKQLTEMWTKNKDRYTHVMFCRPDVVYLVKISPDWFSFASRKLYIPNTALFENMNDKFAIGQCNEMIHYGNRFNDVFYYRQNFKGISEIFLLYVLNKYKIKFQHINFYLLRIRANFNKDKFDTSQIQLLTRKNHNFRNRTKKYKHYLFTYSNNGIPKITSKIK